MNFDYPRFYAALDAVRVARGLSWYGVFKQTYLVMFMHPANFLKKHPRLSKTSRAIICAWAGLDEREFVVESAVSV
jgi:hypothetical protein